MFYTIYQITNLVNGKIYIGKHETKDPNDNYLGSGKMIRQAIEKYGIESFSKDVLFVFDNELDMNSKEKELVTEEFVKLKSNYNLCPGGQGGFGYLNSNGLNNSGNFAERRANISESIKTVWKNQNYRNNFSLEMSKRHSEGKIPYDGFKGKKHTEEWKKNQSQIMKEKSKGSKNSQFGTCWIYDPSSQKNLKIQKELLDEYLIQGYKKGRILVV